MRRKLVHFLLLSALVAVSTLALADPPARVGRISSTEGKVTVQADGEEAGGSLLNWPLTSDSRITTAPGARMEFRIGSAAVRLDGDSSLEVLELDDDSLRLRLDYGSAIVRVRSAELLGGFELSTPQARVSLTEPGSVRIDTERAPDTSVVTVLAGTARVDGAGTVLNVRAGKRAEVRGDDVSTGLAQRDRFDDWAQARDKRDDNVTALRYVTPDVTGYEELDQYGAWRNSDEYGPLWAPRSVAADWAPYRDGRWTWLEPWGWTWVDNAPWGYAPSHYGRWVFLDRRWFWAPGRSLARPVWAPALVGWVGNSGWNVTFSNRQSAPGVGWFPLTPRDHYVPSYRVSAEHERRLDWQHNGKWTERDHRDNRDGRRDGVTVLPRAQFDARHTVQVNQAPRVIMAPGEVRNIPQAVAPAPLHPFATAPGRVIETRRERGDWQPGQRQGRSQGGGQGQAVAPLPTPQSPQALHTLSAPPAAQAAPQNPSADRREREDWRDRPQRPGVIRTQPFIGQQPGPAAPVQPVQGPQPQAPQPVQAPQAVRMPQPVQAPTAPQVLSPAAAPNPQVQDEQRHAQRQGRNPNNEGNERGDRRARHEADGGEQRGNQQRPVMPAPLMQQMGPQPQQQPQMPQPQPIRQAPQAQPQAMPQPVMQQPRQAPQPQAMPQPQPQQGQAAQQGPQNQPSNRSNTNEARKQREQERENRGRKAQE
ncbi:MAG: DUF6600 domain-containing protein [Pseudomonadota bacterium]